MFDFEVMKHEDVIWINELNPSFIPTNVSGCFDTPDSPECQIRTKVSADDIFYDPTDLKVE